MTITYRNSFADLIRFNLFHLPRTLVFWLVNAGVLVVFGWMSVDAARGALAPLAVKVLVATFMTLASWGVVLFLQLLVLLVSYGVRSNRGFLTEHTICLSAEGVDEVTPLGRQFTAWPGIVAVRENRRYIFIYVQQHGAHVLPKLAFPDLGRASVFHNRAVDYWRHARETA